MKTKQFEGGYPRVAWCTGLSPHNLEHFQALKEAGIAGVVVMMGTVGQPILPTSTSQVTFARGVGLPVHVSYQSDLEHPTRDAQRLVKQRQALGLGKRTRVCLVPCVDIPDAPDLAQRVESFWLEVAALGASSHTDLCTTVALYHANPRLAALAERVNLVSDHQLKRDPGLPLAGTWLYTPHFELVHQTLAIDFLGNYCDPYRTYGCQLSLEPVYVAQQGDTWPGIAYRQGLTLATLLRLNQAGAADFVRPGQRVRLA